ncbi:MAG: MATE family efflux transporter [Oscillibacter sp.]|nr:MATE family efflux transporter [Oscillibacter sp.]
MKQKIDMINGPILSRVLVFAIPLMASNVLQLLFNAVDIVVVGRFAGHTSLAAVGSTTSIVNLFTNLLIGMSVGVNVLVARFLGQGGQDRQISKVLHTSLFVALAGGVVLGGAGFAASPAVLRWMDSPADTYPLTLLYLRIYFCGTPFVMFYNYGAAALRARGDTRRPLVYLTVSGVVNLVLNLIFVIALHMKVEGVALATVISQLLSAYLVLRCLKKGDGPLHFSWGELRAPDWWSFRAIARVGIPAGVQGCLFSLSNVVIQGAINSYGSVVMAGSSASINVESFLNAAMNAFHHACQTFISQNVGAGRQERIGPILRRCLGCQLGVGAALGALIYLLRFQLIGLYNTDPAVIAVGAQRLAVLVAPYLLLGMVDVLTGAVRGCGAALAPVIINLLGTCGLRLVWISVLDTAVYGVEYVYLCYPVTWTVVTVCLTVCYIHLRQKQKKEGLAPC